MALRYGGRKLSFDVLSTDYDYDLTDDNEPILYRSISDSFESSVKSNRRKRKGSRKKKIMQEDFGKNNDFNLIERIKEVEEESITEKRVDAVFDDLCSNNKINSYENGENGNELCENVESNGMLDIQSYSFQTVICEEVRVLEKSDESSVRTLHHISSEEKDYQILNGGDKRSPFVEVRRRSRPPSGCLDESVLSNEDNSNINSNSINNNVVVKEEMKSEVNSKKPFRSGSNGGFDTKLLEKTESLDWKQLMTEDSDFSYMERSPVGYFMGKIYSGNSLHGTTTIGNEKERERVYDTMFHLPWRCERIISVGYFVCLDSFLSLLTIMPARILMTIWRFIRTRQFSMPSAAELSDFSCFVVLVCGVTLLQQADISLIYHMIRGQGTIKLYVVYNVLEIFDKLCQNFGGDVLQTLFSSAKGLASSLPENRNFWLWRFVSDQALAIVSSIMHSFVLLAQAITLSTCIVSHNNALLALLVSNNFAEIKSNVFKRFSRDNIHSLVYFDSIERFHISAFILFVLAQNILEGEGAWFWSFLSNASVVYSCEMLIDIIKHSFIAKFNEIKPIAYSEFLEDLCKQTLNIQPEDGKQNILTFVPLAPACVVIRVLTPVYAAHLPYGPIPWRLLWIFLLSAMTYVMLASLKIMVGMGLQKFATWYVNRCQRRKLHSD